MRSLILLLGLLFSTVSCANDFEKYVTMFELDAVAHKRPEGLQAHNMPIKLQKPKNKKFIGVCLDGHVGILIQPNWWKDHTPSNGATFSYAQKALIYHELGHCVLNRLHDDRINVDAFGVYKRSLMHHIEIDGEEFRQHEQYYIRELFQ